MPCQARQVSGVVSAAPRRVPMRIVGIALMALGAASNCLGQTARITAGAGLSAGTGSATPAIDVVGRVCDGAPDRIRGYARREHVAPEGARHQRRPRQPAGLTPRPLDRIRLARLRRSRVLHPRIGTIPGRLERHHLSPPGRPGSQHAVVACDCRSRNGSTRW